MIPNTGFWIFTGVLLACYIIETVHIFNLLRKHNGGYIESVILSTFWLPVLFIGVMVIAFTDSIKWICRMVRSL